MSFGRPEVLLRPADYRDARRMYPRSQTRCVRQRGGTAAASTAAAVSNPKKAGMR